MASYPRYTTYGVGELEQTLRSLDRGSGLNDALPSPAEIAHDARSPKGILTRHTCRVSYPDGATGDCHYLRGGPAWHMFRYEHRGDDGKIHMLPAVHVAERLANTVHAIEEIARHRAEESFWSAVLRERKEYFQRASTSEGTGRKARPERFQMKAARAKTLSGKYALCRKVGRSRIPVSDYFDDLKEAVTAWEEQEDKTLVIACCNRLDRCWEEPHFNPLWANPDYPRLPILPLPPAPMVLPPTAEDFADAGEWDRAAEPDEDWDRGMEEEQEDETELSDEDCDDPFDEEETEP